MGRWDYYYYDRFPASTPREAKGGIKAQSKRGSFGEKWWAKRWIDVLESFHIGARLQRGRSYARRGQVLSIDIAEGSVKASVQGSRARPYKVEIKVRTLPAAAWDNIGAALSRQAIFTAKLLAGELPRKIEHFFEQEKLSLFPDRLDDLETDCSCPDWSNPCKHIAAVYYLLGEEFDRDPFLILKLRGMAREKLLKRIGGAASARPATEQAPAREPLPVEAGEFWNGGDVAEDLYGEVVAPPVPGALPRRLGKFPFWRGGTPLLVQLEPVYEKASAAGVEVFVGEWSEARSC